MSRPTRADPSGRAYLDLQNRARREGRSTQELLTLYALERFLARLAMSRHAGTFVLKGGMLLAALNARRATVDVDLLATHLDHAEQAVLERVVEIASLVPELDDGVEYAVRTARARIIREAALYAGVRVTMDAQVSSATVRLQLDVNFGDPITPAPVEIDYPTLRSETSPVRVLGYPLVTVLAEKLSTAIDLGQANSRVRDYADLWTLTGIHDVDGDELRVAIEATSAHRGVRLRPLSEVVADLGTARAQAYIAYRHRIRADAGTLPHDLADLVAEVTDFADPVLKDVMNLGSRWQAASRTWLAVSARPDQV
jgi:hypothetical protein